jgi:hypothetical protein
LRKITLKEEGFILAHGFRKFSSWSLGSIFGPVVRQHIMAEEYGGRKLVTLWKQGSGK